MKNFLGFCLVFASLVVNAANVSFVVTNTMTGQPDTNGIWIQALNPNANPDGSYNSVGLPTIIFPPIVWTNMYQGFYSASNQFIVQSLLGPGLPGTSAGVIFAVDNSTNSYSFLRYPQSGYGVGNWYAGLAGAYGTNGINTGITNGVLTIDGSGITASVSSNGIQAALGYIPPSLPTITNTEAAYIQAQGGANSNYTLAQIQASNNVVQSNIGASNFTTLQTVTNFTLSSIANSNAQIHLDIQTTNTANLNTTTNFVLYAVGTNTTGLLSAISATNVSNLAITTNLVINASNSTVANLNGTIFSASNSAVTSAGALVGIATNGNNAVTFNASNQVAATALNNLSLSNLAQSSALIATQVSLVNGINNGSNANQNFTLSISNQTATALSYAIGASNRTTSNLGVIVVVSNTAYGAQAYGQGVSNLWINGSNQFLGIVSTASNGAVNSAIAGTGGSQATLSNSVFSALTSSNTAQVALVNLASNQNASISFNASNVLTTAIVGSNNAANAYTFGVSNLVVNNFAFGKGNSNSLVAGTNTLTAWTLAQIQASNAAVTLIANGNLLSASNYLSTNLASQIAVSGSNSAALATNLSGYERAALLATNLLTINQSSNTAQGITIASNALQNLQYSFGTNWTTTNLLAQIAATNFQNLVINTNLDIALSNNLVASDLTNFINSTNFAATLGSNFVTFTTNIIGVTSGGSGSANGTYLSSNSTTWTNVNNPLLNIILSGGTFYIQSNSIALYSVAGIPGVVSVVNGTTPVPVVNYGRYVNLNGQLFVGWANWFTNIVGTGGGSSTNGLATIGFVTNYVQTATNGLAAVSTNGASAGQFYEFGTGWVGISTGTGITTNYGGVVSLQFPLNVFYGTNSILTNSTLSGTFYGNGAGLTSLSLSALPGTVVTNIIFTNSAIVCTVAGNVAMLATNLLPFGSGGSGIATNYSGVVSFTNNNNVFGANLITVTNIQTAGATASGTASVAFGYASVSSGANSFTANSGNTASGQNAAAFGNADTAFGLDSFVYGYQSYAGGICSFAGGFYAVATNYSFNWNDGSKGPVLQFSPSDHSFAMTASNGLWVNGVRIDQPQGYGGGGGGGNGNGGGGSITVNSGGGTINPGFQSINTNIIVATGFGWAAVNGTYTNAGGGTYTNMANNLYSIVGASGPYYGGTAWQWQIYSNYAANVGAGAYAYQQIDPATNYTLYYGAFYGNGKQGSQAGVGTTPYGITYAPQYWNMTPVTLNGVLNSTNLTWQITNAIAGNVNPNVVTNTQPQVIFGHVALTNAIINEINPLGNVGIGNTVLSSITTGAYNVAFGLYALSYDYTGNYNIAIGGNSLANLGAANSQGGSNNIAIGINSGVNFTVNESSNIDIGNPGIGGENNIIRIGTGQTDTYLTGVVHGNGSGLTGITAAQVGAVSTNQFALALTNTSDFASAALDLRNGGQLSSLVDMASFVASEGYTNYSYTGQFITATNVTFTQRGAKFNHLGQIQWPAAVGPTNTVVIVWNQDATNTDSIGGMLGGLQNTNTGDSEYFAYGGNGGGNLGWVNWFMASGTNVWPAAGGNITNLLQFVRQDGTYDYVTAARPRHVTMAQNNGQGQVLVWNDGVPAQWYKTSLTNQTFPIYPSAMNAIVLGQPLITNGMYYGTNTFAGYVESVQVYNTATFTNLPQLAVWVSDWLQAAHNKTFWLGDSRFAWQGASAGAGGSSAGTNIATFIDSLAGRSDFVSYQEFLGGSTVAGAGPATNIIAMNLPHGKIRTTEVEMGGGVNDFRGAGTPAGVLNTISNYFYLPFAKVAGYYLDVWDVWQVGTNSSSNVTWSLTIQTNIANYDLMAWTNRTWIRNVYPCSAVVPQFMLNSNNVPRYSTDSLHFADPTNGIAAYSSLAGLYISLVNNPFTVPGQPLNTAQDGTLITNLQSSALVGLLPTNTIPNGVLTTNGAASNGLMAITTNTGTGWMLAAPSGGAGSSNYTALAAGSVTVSNTFALASGWQFVTNIGTPSSLVFTNPGSAGTNNIILMTNGVTLNGPYTNNGQVVINGQLSYTSVTNNASITNLVNSGSGNFYFGRSGGGAAYMEAAANGSYQSFFFDAAGWNFRVNNTASVAASLSTTPSIGLSVTNVGCMTITATNGLNTGGYSLATLNTVTLPASGTPWTNTTPVNLVCYFSGGTAYSVSVNGTSVYSSLIANEMVLLSPTNYFTVTYTVAPTCTTNRF